MPPSSTCPSWRSSVLRPIEIMPVAEFPGHHGWGYDGVYISAAHSCLRRARTRWRDFVGAAHEPGWR